MDLGPFVNMNWADLNSAVGTKDATDRGVHQRSRPPPKPNGGRGRWEDVHDQRGAHHPVPSPTDRRYGRDPGQTGVGQEAPY